MKTTEDTIVRATCISCQRTFWATDYEVARVQAGQTASLCLTCCGEPHDDKDEREG